jgi:DNA-binding SARP family transcriptional activator
LLEFRILGPLEVADEPVGAVDLGGPRQRATLAILLLHANRVVSVDQIAEDLYAGAAPATALKQVQRQISELRKALGSESVIETRSPGYVIRLAPEQLDLSVFERLAAEAGESEAAGDAQRAADLLRAALDLWRGEALADLSYEPFARAPIERLEEIRLAVLEQRIDADLALGRHAQLVPELEQLVVDERLRERIYGQLMLALYRSGRQAEALEAYRQARDALVEECGLEPGPGLRRLERQILEQDPSLELQPGASRGPAPSAGPERTVLAAPVDDAGIARLVALAQPLAGVPGSELIVARLVGDERELGSANESLRAARRQSEATMRVAAFASADPPADLVRLATAYDAALVLLEAPPAIAAPELPEDVAALLEQSPADVAIACGTVLDWAEGDGIFVPFGGAEHDWAALELAAWLASVLRAPLRLVGSRADPAHGQRDASRLLANASLAVQRLADVIAEPVLADAFLEALENATVVVGGLSARWRTEGLGELRRSLLRAGPPVVFVHAGRRPSGLAPRDARTRFSWSLAA